ncbi:isochorismate synthase [Paenibacillus chitinolyticus]|uniref:isochorismate synthase n=1 Tax=Paenibacillus chitinolyticus TaxID=79263 RepID=A0A410WZ79_9BACL|nr:isochorismate synthase DhbC [Paenibacillus chitinolyticus]MCY9590367.1 isochorismate synthase DhbC [Paenibacillus chitinolyticus]MCY9596639.1 isochorismate synthase DhbC [Paenibacillus chitinolyticus]QAV19643.1 isochorismate synthase [Paenibacillus chitinolyticus]
MMLGQKEKLLSPADLLDKYSEGSAFYFGSPRRTLLAEGELVRLSVEGKGEELERLPRRVADLLAGVRAGNAAEPVIVGAIPFTVNSGVRPELFVPRHTEWAGPLADAEAVQADVAGDTARSVFDGEVDGGTFKIVSFPTESDYEAAVRKGLEQLRSGKLRKVVLSRSLRLENCPPVQTGRLLRRLAASNTRGYTFAVPLRASGSGHNPGQGQGTAPASAAHTLIGASPELLVARSGQLVTANPLAGSAARSSDPAEDKRRADALLLSAKDRHEHAVVVDAVASALRPYCRKLDVPAEPSVIGTKTMWHLSTKVTGELLEPAASSLELAVAMHPTPAVCGTPTGPARTAIRELESFDRRYFTGMVGWCDAAGDGEWAVTIRCAEIAEDAVTLYAGAGIVEGSDPAAELAETSSKLKTLLLAMGMDPDTGSGGGGKSV